MVREIIAFYATVLDEAVGKPNGANELISASRSRDLFNEDSEAPIDINLSGRFPIAFHSSTFRLKADIDRTFMGTFWESRAVRMESINPLLPTEYPYGYVGIDREILVSIQNRTFERLLKMRNGRERIIQLRSDLANGVLYLDRYGVLRAWLDRVPDVIDFEVPGEL